MRISLVLTAFLYIGAGTKETKLTEGIQPGNLAPEIHLQGVKLKGDGYVLVQFWAAYDPQSRLENTRMYRVISRSDNNPLRMVAISLDEHPAIFQGIIKADHLDEASQWNEVRGMHSAIFKDYRLKNGFGNYLLDSNGVIVAKNLSPTEVLERVAL
jgi:hypothetical protein